MNAIIAISGTKIRHDDGLYSLNDLHKASGGEKRHQPANWLRSQQAVEVIAELCGKQSTPHIRGVKENQDVADYAGNRVIKTVNGGNMRGTFVCKELVIHYGMWISPEFSLKVIRTFLDATEKPEPKISEMQQYEIQYEVQRINGQLGEPYQRVYSELHEAFGISRYQDLPAKDFDAAIGFLNQPKYHAQPRYIRPQIDGDGRWLVVVENRCITTVKNLKGHSIVDADGYDKLMQQTIKQAGCLVELARRMRYTTGDCSKDRLDKPIEELAPVFIV